MSVCKRVAFATKLHTACRVADSVSLRAALDCDDEAPFDSTMAPAFSTSVFTALAAALLCKYAHCPALWASFMSMMTDDDVRSDPLSWAVFDISFDRNPFAHSIWPRWRVN